MGTRGTKGRHARDMVGLRCLTVRRCACSVTQLGRMHKWMREGASTLVT